MLPDANPGAHAKGHHANSIVVAYEGGLDVDGKRNMASLCGISSTGEIYRSKNKEGKLC